MRKTANKKINTGLISHRSKKKSHQTLDTAIPLQIKNIENKAKNWVFDFLKLFAISIIVIFILSIVVSQMFPSQFATPSWKWDIESGKLQKQSKLTLYEGQSFTYEIDSENLSDNLTLIVIKSPLCLYLMLVDITTVGRNYGSIENAIAQNPGAYTVCLSRDGYETNLDNQKLGTDLDFTNSSWPFYAPWMLAINKNFSWDFNRTLKLMPVNVTYRAKSKFVYAGMANISKREAFKIIAKSEELDIFAKNKTSSPNIATLYIDSEYRVLLLMETNNSQIRLINASFLD